MVLAVVQRLGAVGGLCRKAVADAEVGVNVAPAGEVSSSFWRTLRTNTSTERSPRFMS